MSTTTTTTTSTHTRLKASSGSAASHSTSPATNSSTPIQSPESSEPNQTPDNQQKQEEEPDIYDEIEIEDMTYDPKLQIYHYPCPCGDRFEISLASLKDGETEIAVCPSCSLMIRVIFEVGDLVQEEGATGT